MELARPDIFQNFLVIFRQLFESEIFQILQISTRFRPILRHLQPFFQNRPNFSKMLLRDNSKNQKSKDLKNLKINGEIECSENWKIK